MPAHYNLLVISEIKPLVATERERERENKLCSVVGVTGRLSRILVIF